MFIIASTSGTTIIEEVTKEESNKHLNREISAISGPLEEGENFNTMAMNSRSPSSSPIPPPSAMQMTRHSIVSCFLNISL